MPAAARAPARAPAAARGGAAATQDPRFKKLIADLKKGAARTKQHPPAAKKAAEAQAAAKGPANEKMASAKAKQVDKMGEAEGKKPEASGFLALLRAEIEKVMPKNLEDATKFMKGGEKEQIKSAASGNVAEQKQAAAGPVESAAKAPPNASGEPAKESTPIPGEPAAPLPSVNTANAVPLPKPAEQVSQEQSKKDADQALKDAEVTPDQLKKANDPRFSAVLTAKSTVEKVADASPAKYRAGEKAALAQGIAKATGDARKGVSAIGGVKAGSQTAVKSKQDLAKEKDEAERKKVTDKIESIYNATKAAVEAKLATLESDVSTKFDRGMDAALASMKSYANAEIDKFYDARYSGARGKLRWLEDKFSDVPEGVRVILASARKRFTGEMDALAVDISSVVDKRLADAKAEVAKGQTEVDTYVKSLPKSLQSVGKAAAEAVAERFKELEAGIDEKANDLAQKLAQKYKDAHDKADAELKKIEEENKGAFKKLADKIGDVVKALMEFKAKLMAVIRKGEEAIKMILKDPIGFLGNLIAAIKQGFQQFVGNILAHLKKGFMEWLFGTLTSAGVQIPSDLSLPSILKLVLGVLGITYDRMRAKAVKLIGERNVKIIEKLVEYITKLIQGGPAALWEQVKADLSDLKAMVIDAIQTWLIETVVKQAVLKVVSMFNPAGAIVQAVITIYNVVMFIVERASQIMALVEAVVNSVHAIASGAIGGAANWIEQALARMIPVAIGLLARLIGLGGISDKIKGFIQKVQAKVDKAIDKAIAKIVETVKKLFGKLTGSGAKGPDERTEQQKKDDLKKALAESDRTLAGGKINPKAARTKLQAIRSKYRLTSLELITSKKGNRVTVRVRGKINPEGDGNEFEIKYQEAEKQATDAINAVDTKIKDNVQWNGTETHALDERIKAAPPADRGALGEEKKALVKHKKAVEDWKPSLDALVTRRDQAKTDAKDAELLPAVIEDLQKIAQEAKALDTSISAIPKPGGAAAGGTKKWPHDSITKLNRRRFGAHQVEVHVDNHGPHIHLDRGGDNPQYIHIDDISSAADVDAKLPGALNGNPTIQNAALEAVKLWKKETGQ